jgi:hypothetical protein
MSIAVFSYLIICGRLCIPVLYSSFSLCIVLLISGNKFCSSFSLSEI